MIGKDDKINYLYIKSKPSFETLLLILRKLVEPIKIHLQYNFGSSILKRKVVTAIFLKLPRHKPGTHSRGAKIASKPPNLNH